MERVMDHKELKVGDKIRIIKIPGEDDPDFFLDHESRLAYEQLIMRGRSLRVFEIDESGFPHCNFRFRKEDGSWQWHTIIITELDNNWVKVVPHVKHSRQK
jgi:hypothetical protein